MESRNQQNPNQQNQPNQLTLSKFQEKYAEDNFCCPITLQIMLDPVFASDGFTYEREAIKTILNTTRKSPMTNELLTDVLTPNRAMKSQIEEYLTNKKIKQTSAAQNTHPTPQPAPQPITNPVQTTQPQANISLEEIEKAALESLGSGRSSSSNYNHRIVKKEDHAYTLEYENDVFIYLDPKGKKPNSEVLSKDEFIKKGLAYLYAPLKDQNLLHDIKGEEVASKLTGNSQVLFRTSSQLGYITMSYKTPTRIEHQRIKLLANGKFETVDDYGNKFINTIDQLINNNGYRLDQVLLTAPINQQQKFIITQPLSTPNTNQAQQQPNLQRGMNAVDSMIATITAYLNANQKNSIVTIDKIDKQNQTDFKFSFSNSQAALLFVDYLANNAGIRRVNGTKKEVKEDGQRFSVYFTQGNLQTFMVHLGIKNVSMDDVRRQLNKDEENLLTGMQRLSLNSTQPVVIPVQQNMGYPQQQSMGYPQQQNMGYPQQQNMGYPQQQGMGYPQQQGMGYPQQQSMGYPQQQGMGYPQQQDMGYPQQPMNSFITQQGTPSQGGIFAPHNNQMGQRGLGHSPAFNPTRQGF